MFSACVAIFAAILPSFASAQSAPATEKQKIEALIEQVGDLKDAKFVRNGSTYEPATASPLSSRQMGSQRCQVKTARDFIDKLPVSSGTSGKPYLIRFKDGREIKSQEFLIAALNKIEPKL